MTVTPSFEGERSPLHQSTILVTGGSGGLASQILRLFLQRGCQHIHSLDLRHPLQRLDGITYHVGDLTDGDAMRSIFQAVKPTVVLHTASPKFDAPSHIMYKVNVAGTKTLVEIAQAAGTTCFLYTSSASVISDTYTDLIHADESWPVLLDAQQPDVYVRTKALAETYVLSQNRRRTPASTAPPFLTCAIRPSGIFGVGDLVVLPGILDAYYRGQTKVQIGNNRNLFDFTESRNVAYAHYLAAAALATCHTRDCDLPSDDARVDGEAFFVTNGEAWCFWDFARRVWGYAAGDANMGEPTRPEQVWVLGRTWALVLAGALEWAFWALGWGEAPLTRTKVRLSCMTRYFCIDKARKRLGYAPLVALDEGLKQAVEDCVRRRNAEQQSMTSTGKQKRP